MPRRVVVVFVGLLVALVAVPLVFDTVEWAAEKSSAPPHVARPTAAPQVVPSPAIEELTPMTSTTTTATSLPPPEPPPVPVTNPPTSDVMPVSSRPAALSSDVGEFLACVRHHESGGDYSVVSPDGQYHGAYQFLQSSWDTTARHAGRDDLVGVAPESASPADQDAMAAHLYGWVGPSPWNGSGC